MVSILNIKKKIENLNKLKNGFIATVIILVLASSMGSYLFHKEIKIDKNKTFLLVISACIFLSILLIYFSLVAL